MEEENKKSSAKDILEEAISSVKTQKIYNEQPGESGEGNQFNRSQEELLEHIDDLKSENSSDEVCEEEKSNEENDFNLNGSESVENSENINEDTSKENSSGNVQNNDKNDIKNAITILITFIFLGPVQFVILYFVKDFIAAKFNLVQSQAWVVYGFSCVFALWISIVSCSYLACRIEKEDSFPIFEGIITTAIIGVILGLVCWGVVALIPNFGLLKANILRFLHLDPFSQGQLGVSYIFGTIMLLTLFAIFIKIRNKKPIGCSVVTLILLVVSLWLTILTMQNWDVIVAFFWDKIFPAIVIVGILAIIAMVWKSQFTCPHCNETWALEKIDEDIQDGYTKAEKFGNEYRHYRIQHIKEKWRCSKCGGTVIRSRDKKIRL